VRESYIDASEMMDSSQGDTAGVSSLHSSDKHHAGTPYDTMDDIKVPPVMCQTLNMLPPRNVSKPTEIPKPDEKPKAKPKAKAEPQEAKNPATKPVVCHTLGQSQKISSSKSEERSDTKAVVKSEKIRRRQSSMTEQSDEMILKAINEATDRTRQRAEEDLQLALQQQSEQHDQEMQEVVQQAVQQAVDDTIMGMQERVRVDEEKGFVRGEGNSKRELKAMKHRCRELQDQTKRLTSQVDKHKQLALDAAEDARRSQAEEERARHALDRAQAQTQSQAKELAHAKSKMQQLLPHSTVNKSKEFKATALRSTKLPEKKHKDPRATDKLSKGVDFRSTEFSNNKKKPQRERTKSVTFESSSHSRRNSSTVEGDDSLQVTMAPLVGLVFSGDSEAEAAGYHSGYHSGAAGQILDGTELEGLRNENDCLRSHIEEIEAHHDELVQAKVRELQEALDNKDLSLSEAFSRVGDLDSELLDVKKQLSNKEGMLRDTEHKVHTLEAQLKEIDQINWDLEREVKRVTDDLKEMDGKLLVSDGKLNDTSGKYKESMDQLKQIQQMSAQLDATAVAKLEAVVSSEQNRRIEVEQESKKTTEDFEQLRASLTVAREECDEAKQLAQSECRRSMMAVFAENSSKKQLAALRKELQEAQDQISHLQLQAKEELERERKKVSKLQRELASTKEMLRASQRSHKKHSPMPKKHHGNSPQEVLNLARAEVFGRPHEIETNKATHLNPLRQHSDWEDSVDSSMSGLDSLSMGSAGGLDVLNAARARIFGGQEEEIWSTLDVAMSPKVGSDLSSPFAEMESMGAINEAIERELHSASPITLPPIR